jgi:uncharacterized protein YukE
MPITRAQLGDMLTAVQNLSDAIPQANSIGNQTDDTLTSVQAHWHSPTAAPTFYQKLTTWQSDHQELKTMLANLSQTLTEVYQDLLKKEKDLTS